MPNEECIRLAEEAILTQMGRLEDLPRELSNFIANVYYKFFEMDQSLDEKSLNVKESSSHNYSKVSGLIEYLPAAINDLRKLNNDPPAYQAMADFWLDNWKYDIVNAHRKSKLRRTIERALRRNRFREIPNLIDLMNL